jgi:taurine dioxygenase
VEKLLGDTDPKEDPRLLNLMPEHVDREAFYYAHYWQAGDPLIWDNRCTNHRRAPFETPPARVMRRREIAGTRPL